jgi:hypothetical protein
LAIDGSDLATWTWTGVEPNQWAAMLTGDTNIADASVIAPGGTHSGDVSAYSGQSIYVIGVDAGVTMFTTPASNDVVAT